MLLPALPEPRLTASLRRKRIAWDAWLDMPVGLSGQDAPAPDTGRTCELILGEPGLRHPGLWTADVQQGWVVVLRVHPDPPRAGRPPPGPGTPGARGPHARAEHPGCRPRRHPGLPCAGHRRLPAPPGRQLFPPADPHRSARGQIPPRAVGRGVDRRQDHPASGWGTRRQLARSRAAAKAGPAAGLGCRVGDGARDRAALIACGQRGQQQAAAAGWVPSASAAGAQQTEPASLPRMSESALTTYTSQGSPPGPVTQTLSWTA